MTPLLYYKTNLSEVMYNRPSILLRRNTTKENRQTIYKNSCTTKKYSYICSVNQIRTAMGRNKVEGLTVREEEIMDLFWDNGPMFVRELLDHYEEPKPHFNTLSTIVRSLEEKGFLSHRSYGKTYRYFAEIKREEYRKNSLRSVIMKYFDASPFNAVSALVRSEELSADELRRLLDMVEKGKD